MRAARQVPIYKPVIDALLIMPMDQWTKITSEELYHQLEAVCANESSIYAVSTASTDSLHANVAKVKKQKQKQKVDTPCFNFLKGKPCRFNPCNFSHAPEQKTGQSSQPTPPAASPAPVASPAPAKCTKCGGDHHPRECKLQTVCPWCARIGHLEHLCNSKKAGKPQALVAHEGSQLKCNMVLVDDPRLKTDPEPVCYSTEVSFPIPPGCVTEKFYADTGANRSIHPNGRSAATFYRLPLEISTASAGKPMRSEGVVT